MLALIHRPNVIAAAAIVCACQQLEFPLPAPPLPPLAEMTESERMAVELLKKEPGVGEATEEEPYWLELLDVKVEEVKGESFGSQEEIVADEPHRSQMLSGA